MKTAPANVFFIYAIEFKFIITIAFTLTLFEEIIENGI